MRLEEIFVGAAAKYLSAVEADSVASNQHEINGAKPLARLLGEPAADGTKRRFTAAYLYLSDEGDPLVVESTATWYEARANHPTRSEFRFYYPARNEVMERARAGDVLIVAKAAQPEPRELLVIVSPRGSSVSAQLEGMFGLEPSEAFDIETLPAGQDLTFTERELLELLGYEVEVADDTYLDMLVKAFGSTFPATREFSVLARRTLPDVRALDDPDAALLAWWEREEVLFRTFERHVIGDQIARADGDIDLVLQIAMSAFQRRKSRAGHALENHVEEVLSAWAVPFDAQARTEGKVRPDFLVPGEAAYRDSSFDASRLRLLAVKTTCKDRWRQVISEADRIPLKHLLTLEAPISSEQLDEMSAQGIVLVVPRPLHDAYGTDASRLLDVATTIASFKRICGEP